MSLLGYMDIPMQVYNFNLGTYTIYCSIIYNTGRHTPFSIFLSNILSKSANIFLNSLNITYLCCPSGKFRDTLFVHLHQNFITGAASVTFSRLHAFSSEELGLANIFRRDERKFLWFLFCLDCNDSQARYFQVYYARLYFEVTSGDWAKRAVTVIIIEMTKY